MILKLLYIDSYSKYPADFKLPVSSTFTDGSAINFPFKRRKKSSENQSEKLARYVTEVKPTIKLADLKAHARRHSYYRNLASVNRFLRYVGSFSTKILLSTETVSDEFWINFRVPLDKRDANSRSTIKKPVSNMFESTFPKINKPDNLSSRNMSKRASHASTGGLIWTTESSPEHHELMSAKERLIEKNIHEYFETKVGARILENFIITGVI